MEVTCEVKIDVLHRTTAMHNRRCCAAAPQAGPGMSRAYHDALAKFRRIASARPGCNQGFRLHATGVRLIRCLKDPAFVFLSLFFQKIVINLCFVFSVLLESILSIPAFFLIFGAFSRAQAR